jgi:hypothetical protein
MKSSTHEFWLAMGWTTVSFFLHSTLSSSLFSLLPVSLVLSNLLTHTLSRPLLYLAFLALVSEFYSHLPPGVMALVIFIPWFIRRSFRNQSADLSLLWFGIIALCILLQLLITYSPDILSLASADLFRHSWLPETFLTYFPWTHLLGIALFTTLLVYTLSIVIHYRRVP